MILTQYYNEWQENHVAQNEKDDLLDKLQEQHIVASIGLAKVRNLPSDYNFIDFIK